MKAFSDRNPVVIAVLGVALLAGGTAAVFDAQNLPLVGAGPRYSADFTEAAGLVPGNDVLVAGVKVGTVSAVDLVGTHVRVQFRVKHAWLGNQSTAAIRIKTLLGQKYLALDPVGTTPLSTKDDIPLTRTTSPYDVTTAFAGLATAVGSIDSTQLAQSFEALTGAFASTPPAVHAALTGLAALSQTIASRDSQLQELVANAKAVTATVAGSDQQLQTLFTDGQELLTVLHQRSAAITTLLSGTRDLGVQLAGLVRDNTATLAPALARLTTVTDILQQNQANLTKALSLLGPYYSLLDDATGNGRWLDTYICGLFDAQGAPELDATAARTCSPQAGTTGGSS